MKHSMWYTEEPGPLFAPRRDRSWIGLAVSAILHVVLIAVVVRSDMLPEDAPTEERSEQVDYIPLDPPTPTPVPLAQNAPAQLEELPAPPAPEVAVPPAAVMPVVEVFVQTAPSAKIPMLPAVGLTVKPRSTMRPPPPPPP